MPDPCIVSAGGGGDIVPTPTSNHGPLLRLPTELLVEIVVALNKDHLNKHPRTADPSLAFLRL